MASEKNLKKITVRGITIKINPDVLDDIEVFEWLAEAQDGNAFVFPKLIKRMFGNDYAKVKEKLADKNGITKASDMTDFFAEVMTALNALEAKN